MFYFAPHPKKTSTPYHCRTALQHRRLHTEVVNSHPNAVIHKLTNDIKPLESEEAYTKRSLWEFSTILRKNSMAIYVEKAHLKYCLALNSYLLSPGHIASFKTSDNASIPENQFMSLRNGAKKSEERLTYRLSHDPFKKERITFMYEPHFVPSLETELSIYFLQKADPKVSHEPRYLISFSEKHIAYHEKFAENVFNIIKNQKYYLLADAKNQRGEMFYAFNCVNAVYNSFGIQGKIPSPSPQMAAWSTLKYVFGESTRDEIIEDTNLRTPANERIDDDELTLTQSAFNRRSLSC